MTGRPVRAERRRCLPVQQQVDHPHRPARRMQRRLERSLAHHSVGVEVRPPGRARSIDRRHIALGMHRAQHRPIDRGSQHTVAVGTALRSGRDLRPHRPRAAPRADPSVRDYRTGLLPWVVAAKRCSGQGCRIWGRGSHRSARRLIRSQVSRSCWLRRRSVNSQFRVIWSRKAESALLLSGSGGRGHRSPRLPQIPA